MDSALHIKKEFEKNIPKLTNVILVSEISLLINIPEFPTGNQFGSLSTRRMEYSMESTLICLDYNEHNNIRDYEIEIEFESEPDSDVIKKLASIGVTFDKNVEGKCTRFYNSLNKNKDIM